MDFTRPKRCPRQRTGREDRRSNFYEIPDNLHISFSRATELGIRVTELESDNALQDAVLSVHHACTQTLSATPAIKVIENHNGVAHVTTLGTMVLGPS